VNLRIGRFASREGETERSLADDVPFPRKINHMPHSLSAYFLPIFLLVGSNLFMTAACSGAAA
jgi:hypothetical protein